MLSNVKEALTKEIDVKKFLEMEVELNSIKELLATEIKLKEFLVQEIDLGNFLAEKSEKKSHFESPQDTKLQKSEFFKQDTFEQKKDLPAYDYGLIQSLTEDHKQIRLFYKRVLSFAVEKNYENATIQLDVFNKEIRDHYKKADSELYGYLKTYLQIKYPKREKAFTQLSLEMKNISIEIFYIISQSPNLPLSDETYSDFMQEFIGLGKLLNKRIIREEEVLFKMYEQTNKPKSIS